MAKRINRTDLTLRNLHALKKRIERLEQLATAFADELATMNRKYGHLLSLIAKKRLS